MKRVLLLASFLGIFALALHAQNTGTVGSKQGTGSNQAGGGPQVVGGNQIINGNQAADAAGSAANPAPLNNSRAPNAQVTVTPGPQGLPTVTSSAYGWPILPPDTFWQNGTLQNSLAPAIESPRQTVQPQAAPQQAPRPQAGQPRTANSTRPSDQPSDGPVQTAPVFTPPPRSIGVPPGSAPKAKVITQEGNAQKPVVTTQPLNPQAPSSDIVTSSSGVNPWGPPAEAPAQDQGLRQQSTTTTTTTRTSAPPVSQAAPRQSGGARAPAEPRQQAAPQKNVVVVPSPVHYDRAGRRVIDPGWQDELARIVRQERADNAAGQAGEQAVETEEQAPEPIRETVIVVPGPALRYIRGTLTAAKGMIALEDEDGVLWYLPGMDRYIGFIDGLDAGEKVAVEGYAPPKGSSQERYFQATKLFLDEMDYDLTIPPYGLGIVPTGQTTVIREVQSGSNEREEIERLATEVKELREAQEAAAAAAATPAKPVWEHSHKNAWMPPSSVLDFQMDYSSIWHEDQAKRAQRERDSREIWY
ncbi:MAG: hypothetical protein LBT39_10605 [Treponema sp.]|jgi:hypothetical protein|nr:hypothetical protein [Treponema sp.]